MYNCNTLITSNAYNIRNNDLKRTTGSILFTLKVNLIFEKINLPFLL